MTQAKDSGLQPDALLARYHVAQAELDAHQTAPSAQVRANILAHAAQLADSPAAQTAQQDTTKNIATYVHSTGTTGEFGNENAAANDNQWKIRALASVAMLGLTGLLFLQWNRGTPEEKDVAFNMERSAPAAKAPVPASVPVPVPAAPPPAAPSAAIADAPVVVAAPLAPAPRVAEAATPPSKPAATRPQATANPPPSRAQANPPATAPFVKPVEATTEVLADRSAAPAATAIEPTAPATVAPPAPPSPAPAPLAAAPTARAVAPAAAAAPMAATRAAGAAKSLDSAANAPQVSSMEAAPARLMSPNAALFAAIREADAASLQLALSRGADKNAKSNGTPALTLCVLSNQTALVRQLAAAGADLNALDAKGISPLAHAQSKGLDEIGKLLIELGAK